MSSKNVDEKPTILRRAITDEIAQGIANVATGGSGRGVGRTTEFFFK